MPSSKAVSSPCMTSRSSSAQWQYKGGRLSTKLDMGRHLRSGGMESLLFPPGGITMFWKQQADIFGVSRPLILALPLLQFDLPYIHLLVHLPCHLQSAPLTSVLQEETESSFSSLTADVLHSVLSTVSTFTSHFMSHLSLCLSELFLSCSAVQFDRPSNKK